jgi:hypothetical protein
LTFAAGALFLAHVSAKPCGKFDESIEFFIVGEGSLRKLVGLLPDLQFEIAESEM